jgi:cell division protein FtsL
VGQSQLLTFRLVVWLAVAVMASLFSILAHVWTRLQVVEIGYTLSATRQVVRELEEEHQRLETEWTALTSPARLAQMAHHRLDLKRPLAGQVIVLP